MIVIFRIFLQSKTHLANMSGYQVHFESLRDPGLFALFFSELKCWQTKIKRRDILLHRFILNQMLRKHSDPLTPISEMKNVLSNVNIA